MLKEQLLNYYADRISYHYLFHTVIDGISNDYIIITILFVDGNIFLELPERISL